MVEIDPFRDFPYQSENYSNVTIDTSALSLYSSQKSTRTSRSRSSRDGEGQSEIRIKYTDSTRMQPGDNPQQLYKDLGNAKKKVVEIKILFCLVYGETQNFSIPIYSGSMETSE